MRLDAFLARALDGCPRVLCKELVKSGAVLVNGKPAKPSYMLCGGDAVVAELAAPKPDAARFRAMILSEDRHITAISKPAGLLAHPLSPAWESSPDLAFSGEVTLAALILSAYPKLPQDGVSRAGLVHRLDRETSGVMLIAKTVPAQENLLAQFRHRETEKTYLCIARGAVKDDAGVIDVPIGRITGGKLKASHIGRDAVTEYRVLERKTGKTLLELRPRTGRTNQLRVHMAWLGHPVMGDNAYGKDNAAPRLMLHSRSIEFAHPHTGRKTLAKAPVPQDFEAYWRAD